VFAKVSVIGLRVLLSLIDRMGGHFKPYVTSGTAFSLCVLCVVVFGGEFVQIVESEYTFSQCSQLFDVESLEIV